jgi:uncharacterized membrane protein SpoIIM required for sporulation
MADTIITRYGRSERFVIERKEYWEKLKNILKIINSRGVNGLSEEDTREFPNLYRKICSDYELSKTQNLSPDVQDYINSLLQYSHNVLHSSPKRGVSFFIDFFNKDFPKSFMNNWRQVLFIFLLFFGIGIISFVSIYSKPENAKYILSEELMKMMKDSYSQDITDVRDLDSNIFMAGYYIYNNVSIAFQSFVLGITYGIGTLYIVISNAMTIGSIAGFIVSSGYGSNFFNFVIAHSAFELLGLCLAGGAGLSLGLSMIIPTNEKRMVSIKKKAVEISPLILTAAVFITIAAFIEGFISPSKIHILIKITIAAVSTLIIFLYSYKIIFIKFYRNIKSPRSIRSRALSLHDNAFNIK